RTFPAFRQKLRGKLESSLQRLSRARSSCEASFAHAESASACVPKSFAHRLQAYVYANLDTITSPAPVHALSLAAFYFTGSYYQLSKRLFGLRYIFTKHIGPSEQRVGYEVLGVLLVLQMLVQSWLHIHRTLQQATSGQSETGPANGVLASGRSLDPNAYANNQTLLFESSTAPGRGISTTTHTPVLEKPRYGLHDKHVMMWIQSPQQRKCTLCLELMKDPSATTCGHVFCWTCIGDWLREK